MAVATLAAVEGVEVVSLMMNVGHTVLKGGINRDALFLYILENKDNASCIS